MMNSHMAWMTAAVGSVGIFWSYISSLFQRLSSFLIVQIEVDVAGCSLEMVTSYLWETYRKTPFSLRRFLFAREYIAPHQRVGSVGFEIHGRSQTYFRGIFPLFVSQITGTQDNPSRGNMSISFMRGTFDIDQILIAALDKSNEVLWQVEGEQTHRRFKVKKIFGRLRSTSGHDKDAAEPYSESAKSGDITSDHRFAIPLKWKREDLRTPISPSPFKNLFYSPEVESFLIEVKRWKASKAWYLDKGLNWRFGAAFFGPPGTGKTSCARAIAQELDLPVHAYDLTTMGNEELTRKWQDSLAEAPCMVLFEDIDRLFDENKNIKSSPNGQLLTLDSLLNCISGIDRSDGILLIATANDIERLPEALGIPDGQKSTRPGRLDRALHFGELALEGRQLIAKHILSDYPHLMEETIAAGAGETGAQFESRCGQLALAEYWKEPVEPKESELTEISVATMIRKKAGLDLDEAGYESRCRKKYPNWDQFSALKKHAHLQMAKNTDLRKSNGKLWYQSRDAETDDAKLMLKMKAPE